MTTPVDWEPSESPSTPPPAESLAWVERETGAVVEAVEELHGGMSSSVHRIGFAGERAPLVLRRYTLQAWMDHEPEVPHAERAHLELLGQLDLGVDTPTLVAADPDGVACDAPAILMTEVGGRPDIAPTDPVGWAERMAACLARFHDQPAVDGLANFRRWDNPARDVPTWTSKPELWLEAKRLVAGDLPAHPIVFLHRDFHPNNVHWENGEICAVVDWLSLCNGPIAADLSHCRWNLAVLTEPAIADHFTNHYRSLTGYGEEVVAYDLATVLSGPVGPFPTFAWNALGRHDLTSDVVAKKIDEWLDHVLPSS